MQKKYESDLTAKEKRQMELKKIRELKGLERINYLWTYYKVVLVIFVVIVFAISIIATMIKGALTEEVFSLAVADVDYSANTETLEKELETLFQPESLEEIVLDTSLSSVEDAGNQTKLMLVMGSMTESDVVVCNETLKDRYEEQGAFLDWKEVLGEDYETYEPYMTDGYVDMSKCAKWMEQGYTLYEPAYLCVLAGAEHLEAVRTFVEYYAGV